MKYKLLAVDLDGTLVTSKNKISKINLIKMKEFVDMGGKICFLTGRTIHYAKVVADQFYNFCGHKIEIICALNGSYIYDNVNNQILEQNCIDDEVSKDIKKTSLDKKLITAYYNEYSINNKSMYLIGCSGFFKSLVSMIYKKRTNIFKNKDFNPTNTFKINIFSFFKKKQFENYINELSQKHSDKVDIIPTKKYLFEITKKGIDKGYAIDFLEKHFNLDKSEFIALGDSGNDIPMFKKVGLDIAVNDERILKLGYKPKVSLNKKVSEAIAFVIDNYVK